MTLEVLNSNEAQFGETEHILTSHNGFVGEAFITKIYLKNSDNNKYYDAITVKVTMDSELPTNSLFSTTGWSVKFLCQDTQPTELEWSRAGLNTELSIGSIGTSNAADISTQKTIWIRVFCPGNTQPQVKDNIKIIVDYTENTVDAN